MAELRIEQVGKQFADGTRALAGIDLVVGDGELLVLVGPSGCGKSTLLRILAGLEAPTEGRILIAGRDVTHQAPGDRDLAMVFQSYALYPHKSVRENLAFGLRMRRRPKPEIADRVATVAATLGLADLLERRPAQLSGGQRQRVALGRALARDPCAFLLDEPLSNLDAQLRSEMRLEIERIHRELSATMIYVTHDQEEAMTLGTRIAVLRAGRLEQLGTPEEVFDRPRNTFVATFVGAPPMNLLPGTLYDEANAFGVCGPGYRVPLSVAATEPADPGLRAGTAVRVGIRPHAVELCDATRACHAQGEVESIQNLGAYRVVWLKLGPTPAHESPVRLCMLVAPSFAPGRGSTVPLHLPREALHLFDASTGARCSGGIPWPALEPRSVARS